MAQWPNGSKGCIEACRVRCIVNCGLAMRHRLQVVALVCCNFTFLKPRVINNVACANFHLASGNLTIGHGNAMPN